MSPSAAPAAPAGLHTRRCVRHPSREAAARCPSCGEFFCRECVVEHDGKLLCAHCLARAAAAANRQQRRRAAVRSVLATIAGALVLWCTFQAVALLLLKIPPALHDGTVWKSFTERSRR